MKVKWDKREILKSLQERVIYLGLWGISSRMLKTEESTKSKSQFVVILWEEGTDARYCAVVIVVGKRGTDLKLGGQKAQNLGRLLRG